MTIDEAALAAPPGPDEAPPSGSDEPGATPEQDLARARREQAEDRRRLERAERDLAVLRAEALGRLEARLDALTAEAMAFAGPRPESRADGLAWPPSEDLVGRLKLAERLAEKRADEVDALTARLREAERQAGEARAQVDQLVAEAEALRSSTSWRLTAPIRRLAMALRPGRR